MKKIVLYALFFLVTFLGIPVNSYAGFVTDDPSLPPGGEYRKPDPVTIVQFNIDLTDIRHFNFVNPIVTNNGTDETEEFSSTLEFFIGPDRIELNGIVVVVVLGKVGNTTGTFDTEIISMDLTGNNFITGFGNVDIILSESGIFDSIGETTISDFPEGVPSIGGGPSPCPTGPCYKIDSFFDVFFEIEVVQPGLFGSGNGRINLQHNVPEPTTLVLFSAGLGLFGWKNRKIKARLISS